MEKRLSNFDEVLNGLISYREPMPEVTGFEDQTSVELEELLDKAVAKIAMAKDMDDMIAAMEEEDNIKFEMEKRS